MTDFFKRYQTIIVAAVLVALGFVAYNFLGIGKGGAALSAQPSSTASPVEEELIGLLLTLKSIKLDASIFDDSKFQSLQDFSQSLVEEPVGRPNPFAPLGK